MTRNEHVFRLLLSYGPVIQAAALQSRGNCLLWLGVACPGNSFSWNHCCLRSLKLADSAPRRIALSSFSPEGRHHAVALGAKLSPRCYKGSQEVHTKPSHKDWYRYMSTGGFLHLFLHTSVASLCNAGTGGEGNLGLLMCLSQLKLKPHVKRSCQPGSAKRALSPKTARN